MRLQLGLALVLTCAIVTSLSAQDEEPAKIDPAQLLAYEEQTERHLKLLDEFVKITSKVKAKKDVPAAVEKLDALHKNYIALFNGKKLLPPAPDAIQAALDAKFAKRPEGKKFGPELFRLAGNDNFQPLLDTMKALEVLDPNKEPPDPQAAPPKTEWSIEPILNEPAVALKQAEVDLPGWSGDIDALALSPDGKRLATTAHGKEEKLVRAIRIWNLQTGKPELLLQGPHPGDYWSGFGALAFTSDGRRLVSSDSNGEVQIWDLANRRAGKPLKYISSFNPFPMLALSDDGKTAAIAIPGSVKAIDVTTGKVIAERPGLGNPAPITAVAASSDGKYIATAIDTLRDEKRPTLELWSIPDKKLLWRGAPQKEFIGLKFVAEDKRLLALDQSRRLFRFEVGDGKADDGVEVAGRARQVSFSRDGRRLLMLDGYDGALVDTESGQKVSAFGGYAKIPHLRAGDLSADGSLLAIGGVKGFLRLLKAGER